MANYKLQDKQKEMRPAYKIILKKNRDATCDNYIQIILMSISSQFQRRQVIKYHLNQKMHVLYEGKDNK